MSLGIRQIFRQTADLSKTNNTLAAIPGIGFNLSANSIYSIRFWCRCVAGATPGQKTALVGQSVAAVENTVRVMTNTAVLQNADAQSYDGGAVALTGTVEYFGIIRNTTAAAVAFTIQAAQSVTDAGAVVFSDGVLEVTQLQ